MSSPEMRTGWLVLVFSALALGLPVSHLPEFRQARSLYYQVSDGDKQAYNDAQSMFSALHREHPKDAGVEVYYGSLRLLEASRTWALWKKNSLSREGISLMDAAVAAAPSDLEIRFVRAVTTYALPAFFHRKEQSEEDFSFLAQRAASAAKSGELEPRLAAASLYYHAEFLSQQGQILQAKALWSEAIRLAPDSRAARESREALK